MLIYPLFIGLSRPANRLTKRLADTNFMGLGHHLVSWGNSIIASISFVAVYQYYSNTSSFVANPNPVVTFANGYNGDCQSATVMFLTSIPIYLFLALFIYRSDPWKERFYQNKLFLILVIINIISTIFIFYATSKLSFLSVVQIPTKEVSICLAIVIGVGILMFIYNKMLEWW